MARIVYIEGVSAKYPYGQHEGEFEDIPELFGGNFIFTAGNPPEVIYAGEAEKIREVLMQTQLWGIASVEHGADAIFLHRESDSKKRHKQLEDLLRRHQPRMNAPEPESDDLP